MFKLKAVEKRKPVIEGERVTGYSAAKLPVGTYFKVLNDSVSNKGDLIIRVDSETQPFRTIKCGTKDQDCRIGGYWGTALGDYYFSIMYGYKLEDFPEYKAVLESEKRA